MRAARCAWCSPHGQVLLHIDGVSALPGPGVAVLTPVELVVAMRQDRVHRHHRAALVRGGTWADERPASVIAIVHTRTHRVA